MQRFSTNLMVAFVFSFLVIANQTLATDLERVEAEKFFEQQVRPLLADHCIKCHGSGKQEGGLRLDKLDHLLSGGDSGAAVRPGDLNGSLLVSAIRYEDFEMPPTGQLPPEKRAVLEAWIASGAVWPNAGEGGAEIRARSGVTDEDRQYWAFQPIKKVPLPDLQGIPDSDRVQTAVDTFLIDKLHQQGLQMAPVADRRTLLRRLYFDLLGVPPTPSDTAAFLQDNEPLAYERLVDRLLDDSRYGQRWARHWLDLVRYAETDGFKQDAYRTTAYLYRDWVIAAFNQDKPYDQFVLEQLAGDEMTGANQDTRAATGYLRHWIYEYNQRDVRTQWSNILNDLTDITGEVFMGLGVSCARCHDHKFDPVLQRDYYRLQAAFAGFFPVDNALQGDDESLQQYHQQLDEWQTRAGELLKQIEAIEEPVKNSVAKKAIDKFPTDVRPLLRKASDERDGYEQQLADLAFRQVLAEWNSLDFKKSLKGEQKEQWEKLQEKLKEFEKLKPEVPPSILSAGNVRGPKPAVFIPPKQNDSEPVEQATFEVLGAERLGNNNESSIGSRTALANWINSPTNPLPHRVIVNRIWQYHFGIGIVENASDFGRLGTPPSHPELLDWLTNDFLENGRSLKHLHRLLVNSAAYRQSLQNEASADRGHQVDFENRLLWHFPGRRLDAEQIRDAVLVASGRMESHAGGPATKSESFRRTIFTEVRRNTPNPMLIAFDAPDGNGSVPKRTPTTTPNQSLLLVNYQWLIELSNAMATDIEKTHTDKNDQIRAAYQRCLQREPSASELVRDLDFLNTTSNSSGDSGPASHTALADLCHVLFNSSEFLYVD